MINQSGRWFDDSCAFVSKHDLWHRIWTRSTGFQKILVPKLESMRETLWGFPSSKMVGAPETQTWNISPHAFTALSPPCAANAVVRTKTKQRTAIRQAVIFKTRVDVRHMNRYLIAHISILHNRKLSRPSKRFRWGTKVAWQRKKLKHVRSGSATAGEGIRRRIKYGSRHKRTNTSLQTSFYPGEPWCFLSFKRSTEHSSMKLSQLANLKKLSFRNFAHACVNY